MLNFFNKNSKFKKKFFRLISVNVKYLIHKSKIVRNRINNLKESNYNLGIRYINRGNISEAIFRFKIMKKIWPNFYESYYQLVYCFMIKNETSKAKLIIQELSNKNPDYDKKRVEEILKLQDNITND